MISYIWIFVSITDITRPPLLIANDIKYAFRTQEQCEYVIEGTDKLKCIRLELK
jgi:hypothetical protein